MHIVPDLFADPLVVPVLFVFALPVLLHSSPECPTYQDTKANYTHRKNAGLRDNHSYIALYSILAYHGFFLPRF